MWSDRRCIVMRTGCYRASVRDIKSRACCVKPCAGEQSRLESTCGGNASDPADSSATLSSSSAIPVTTHARDHRCEGCVAGIRRCMLPGGSKRTQGASATPLQVGDPPPANTIRCPRRMGRAQGLVPIRRAQNTTEIIVGEARTCCADLGAHSLSIRRHLTTPLTAGDTVSPDPRQLFLPVLGETSCPSTQSLWSHTDVGELCAEVWLDLASS